VVATHPDGAGGLAFIGLVVVIILFGAPLLAFSGPLRRLKGRRS
jgi:hypothetical protein